VRVWVDAAFRYLMVYTGDTLEPADRRRAGIAIEPMTCPPNALRTGVDLIELEPSETWRGTWGIAPGGR
jgi:aldose 1-epimerase